MGNVLLPARPGALDSFDQPATSDGRHQLMGRVDEPIDATRSPIRLVAEESAQLRLQFHVGMASNRLVLNLPDPPNAVLAEQAGNRRRS